MKLDRTPLAIVLAGVLISGAILINGRLDRAAKDPAAQAPSKSEIQAALAKACPIHTPLPKNVIGSPTTGTEVTAIDITDAQPSLDGRKVRVSLKYSTSGGKSFNTEFVLERDEFGKYVGIWQHDANKTYVAVAN
jgi:hypothetical protein